MLSRALSSAFVQMELANVSLEDLIISEITNTPTSKSTRLIVERLSESLHEIRNAQRSVVALGQSMTEKSFTDLPTLASVDLPEIGRRLTLEGMVSAEAWAEVSSIMRTVGFRGMLVQFGDMIAQIHAQTTDLITCIEAVENHAREGTMTLVLEENKVGNFKVEFAQLYHSWTRLQQLFLASSMRSTELWYRFNRFGSLVFLKSEIFKVA